MEHTESPEFPGADGAAKIRRLVESYSAHPPTELDGAAVVKMLNYATDDIVDEEGDRVPKENMLFLDLADGRRFAVRPSGTEPKVKFYFFASHRLATGKKLKIADLPQIKKEVRAGIDRLWAVIRKDIEARLS